MTCALHQDVSYPFQFNVRVDNIGFYLVGGSRCAHHAHHPQKTRELNCAAEKDILVSVVCVKENNGRQEQELTQTEGRSRS
jgi:hypothetical protein